MVFFWVGFADVAAFLTLGAIAMLLVLGVKRRSGHILIADRIEVSGNDWPAVWIEAQMAGPLPLLLAWFGRDMSVRLEAHADAVDFEHAGLFGKRRHTLIPMSQVTSTDCDSDQPRWYIPATAVIMFLVVLYAGAGRLTWQGALAGALFAGASGLVCGLQRTNDLTVCGRGKKIVLSFTVLKLGEGAPIEQLQHAAARIAELATESRRTPAA